jgi:hypothetical protein
LAHSRRTDRRRRWLYLAIPILGAVLVAAVFVLAASPSRTIAVNFSSNLVIEVHEPSNETQVRCVYPSNDVGIQGGYWQTHVYDTYGVDSHYPVYSYNPSVLSCPTAFRISTVSNVNRNYTLGDFFNVWGQRLGPDNTLNLVPSGGMLWVMCVGPSVSTLRPGNWGQELLVDNATMILAYTRVSGCH